MLKDPFVSTILCGLLTTSCAVIKDAPQGQIIKIEKSDFKKLSGQFSNYPTTADGTTKSDIVSTDFKPQTFWSQIDGFKEVGTEDKFKEQTVTLDFISEKKGVVKLWDNGELKKTKTIKGKIRDGYFYRRPYFVAVPFVPLFFGYKTYRYRIGLTNNSIVVDYKWNYWSFFIAAGSKGKGQSNSRFEKK